MSLRKEMIIAIVLGLAMGGIVALALTELPARLLGKTGNDTSQNENLSPTPTPFTDNELSMALLVPDHQAYVESEIVTISGKTQPNMLVVVTGNADEEVTTSDNDGAFSAELTLLEGANEIFAYSKFDGQEAEDSIIINYLEKKVEPEEPANEE